MIIGFVELDVIPTKKLGYYCHDPNLSHPFHGDTISATVLFTTTLVGPFLILSVVEYRKNRWKHTVRVVWKWYKELLVGLIAVLAITEVMKSLLGGHRPHFIESCGPDVESVCQSDTFMEDYTCTNTGFFSTDSSRSFPSGHTSLSVFVSVFLTVSTIFSKSRDNVNSFLSSQSFPKRNIALVRSSLSFDLHLHTSSIFIQIQQVFSSKSKVQAHFMVHFVVDHSNITFSFFYSRTLPSTLPTY